MATVVYQPGLSEKKEYTGSVQYLGGYDGPYVDDEEVLANQKRSVPKEIPIPMGLEVFQDVSKLVAHQLVDEDEGKVTFEILT